VDGQAKNADDRGPGTKEGPFRTINHAILCFLYLASLSVFSGLGRFGLDTGFWLKTVRFRLQVTEANIFTAASGEIKDAEWM
jgi:hypothetical protein